VTEDTACAMFKCGVGVCVAVFAVLFFFHILCAHLCLGGGGVVGAKRRGLVDAG
jgi:hypothetical protein